MGVAAPDRGYRLYVIELSEAAKERFHTDKVCLYVGQSYHSAEERFQQHLNGVRASRHVRKFGVKLRPDLFDPTMVFEAKHQAERAERRLGNQLKHRGYFVVGPQFRS